MVHELRDECQRRRLLAARLAGSREEAAAGLAHEAAPLPQRAGSVEDGLHLGARHAEASGHAFHAVNTRKGWENARMVWLVLHSSNPMQRNQSSRFTGWEMKITSTLVGKERFTSGDRNRGVYAHLSQPNIRGEGKDVERDARTFSNLPQVQ